MRENGTIAWYSDERGFGEVEGPGGARHYFLCDALEGPGEGGAWRPEQGQRVSFELARRGELTIAAKLRREPPEPAK